MILTKTFLWKDRSFEIIKSKSVACDGCFFVNKCVQLRNRNEIPNCIGTSNEVFIFKLKGK